MVEDEDCCFLWCVVLVWMVAEVNRLAVDFQKERSSNYTLETLVKCVL
jgi:hypothetical protein